MGCSQLGDCRQLCLKDKEREEQAEVHREDAQLLDPTMVGKKVRQTSQKTRQRLSGCPLAPRDSGPD